MTDATYELQRLLDERSVKYKSHYLNTLWHAGVKLYVATDIMDGTLTVDNLTPEQAIAATLGEEKAGKKSPPKGGPGPCGQPSDDIIHDTATLGEDEKLLDLAHHAWDIAVCAMQGMPIPASWGNAVENGLRERGIDVDKLPHVVPDAMLGGDVNPDGLPVGLTISEDGSLLNWRGENYVRQSTLSGGKLAAEQVRETVEKHWHDLPADYDMPEATALPEYSYDWQAIADELNATLGGGECELVYGENDYGDDGWWCQSCGEWFAASFRHTGRNNIIKPSYCQHCGKAVKR